jgi:hypothetical protein
MECDYQACRRKPLPIVDRTTKGAKYRGSGVDERGPREIFGWKQDEFR